MNERPERIAGIRILGRLTASKAVANTAIRWLPPFLPTLERAFGATTTQLTTILGIGEMAGLSTLLTGRHLDRGRERMIIVLGLAAVAVAELVALFGTTATFAVSVVLVVVGVSHVTIAGHAFISHRVPYSSRAHAIGLFETSWALSLLVGAPLVALLINTVGWRGPFTVIGIGAAAMAVVIARSQVRAPSVTDQPTGAAPRMTASAWLVVVGSAFVAMAGISVFAISGAWLDDAFGVPTAGLGAVAMGFGAIELLSSLTSARFADRIGKLRSTIGGIAVLLLGAAVMVVADTTLWIGVVGLLTYLCGFEYAIVTSFSLVSEASPAARGTTIARSNAVGTLARGSGAIVGGWLYGIHGVEGTLALASIAALLSAASLIASRRLGGHSTRTMRSTSVATGD